jgi:hypothetical protein
VTSGEPIAVSQLTSGSDEIKGWPILHRFIFPPHLITEFLDHDSK